MELASSGLCGCRVTEPGQRHAGLADVIVVRHTSNDVRDVPNVSRTEDVNSE